jgi:hypothetical protein
MQCRVLAAQDVKEDRGEQRQLQKFAISDSRTERGSTG